MTFKCASFFAGVGGIDLGFKLTGKFQTIYANEFDIYPARTFELNNDIKVDCRDIKEVKCSDVPDADIYLAGFPCTDISIAGERKGLYETDGSYTRSGLFFEVIRLLETNDVPVVFFENVKNLVSHDEGKTFKIIIDSLEDLGYHLKWKVLNATEYGNIPQNRERIYIVGFKDKLKWEKFVFPGEIPLTTPLNEIIDFGTKMDDKYYYTKGKFKGDIYDRLIKAMDDPNAVYQWRRKYVRKNKSGVIPTLTANQGEGGHNVCLVKTKHGIRKMTPKECFNAQGFPLDFKLPDKMSDSRLYKQAGNSVCVSVIERIAEEIAKVMEI